MRFPAFLLPAILLALPLGARAADVPVVYTVDTTALKLAVSGVNLTFELHTNAACTSLAHTQIITTDNLGMLSVLKRSKPKNGVKPPKTTDIRATLTGVAPAAPLYLTVSGTGITPVGGACQVQASTTAGSGGGSLVMRDANGTLLGPVDVTTGQFVMNDAGTPFIAYALPTGFINQNGFMYVSGNCTGPKLSPQQAGAGGFLPYIDGLDGTTLYYGPVSAPLTAIASQDYAPEIPANCVAPGQVFNSPDRCCCTSPVCYPGFNVNAGPPSSMDVSGFVPPFSVSLQ
jgi:hypothetical protein